MSYRDYCGLCGESYDDENLETCGKCHRSFCYHCGSFGEKRCRQCSEVADEAGDVERMQTQEFGCNLCWPTDAPSAWGARDGLTRLKELIDESHFIVAILACPRCDQRYISIFTELIDWEDGNDPQYWTLMPITEAEAEGLIQQEISLNEMSLNSLGRGRRSLRRDHPKVGPPRVFWGSGVFVGPHD